MAGTDEGVTLDQLRGGNSDQGVSLDQLAKGHDQGVSLDQLQSTSPAASPAPTNAPLPSPGQMVQGAIDQVPEPLKKAGSMVAKGASVLAYPQNFLTGLTIRAGAAVGIPGMQQLKDQYVPDSRWLPKVFPSDVSDFYLDQASKAGGIDSQSQQMKLLVHTTTGGLGLALNAMTDPLVATQFMEPTEAASLIKKMGGILENPEEVMKGKPPRINPVGLNSDIAAQKNLVTVGVPFTDISASYRGQGVQDAIAVAASSVRNPMTLGGHDLNPINNVSKVLRALSPDTGIPELDALGHTRDGKMAGDPMDLMARYRDPNDALNLSTAEERLATALVEGTPNLKPDGLPGKIAKAAEARPMAGGSSAEGNPNFWGDLNSIESQGRQALTGIAKSLGIEIPTTREDAIIETLLQAKRSHAENVMDKFTAGVLDETNIAEKLRENYTPHVINPSYAGVKNLKEYQAKVEKDASDVRKLTRGTYASGIDPTRQRVIEGTLEEKNAKALMEKGLDQYYITNPVKAGIANLLKSKKLVRDSEYLEGVAPYGTRMTAVEAKKAGMVAIDHPELNGKTIILKKADGATQVVRHQDLYYPPAIASKIQSRINPPALTGFKAAMRDFNSVFRSLIFMSSPGIKVGNSADNILKTMAISGGGFMDASKEALAVLLNKSEGFRSEATPLRPKGVFYDGESIMNHINRLGVLEGNAWSEGVGPFLDAGKKLTLQDAVARPGQLAPKYAWERAQALSKTIDTFGQKGENWARSTLFIHFLKQGYEPEMAAGEVTKWLFNYNRNSPAMENLRMIMPFMQHPMKTLMVAPQLLGKASGTYNWIQNSMPHVVANAFHDPLTQFELNQVLPQNIRQRDGIAGPFLPGNTWMGHIFQSNKPGPMGSMLWADPRIGLRILNHFDYFSRGGSQRFFGELNPLIQGVIGAAFGEDFTAEKGTPWRDLDYASGNQNVAARVTYALGKLAGAVTPFQNAEKMMMVAFGIKDPQTVEPNSVLMLNGLARQFGGVTDLDHDFMSRMTALRYAAEDQKKQLAITLHQELKGNANAGSIGRYVNTVYGSIQMKTATDLAREMTGVAQQGQLTQSSQQALTGQMNAGQYAARVKGINDQIEKLNFSFQALAARFLQIKSGK